MGVSEEMRTFHNYWTFMEKLLIKPRCKEHVVTKQSGKKLCDLIVIQMTLLVFILALKQLTFS